ncbi:acyloxyacyl hydrolase [Azospirillum sp. ST 5-10]|uniref:acyloxyacyl hydrolase n=1 Tax=unclassified Azospirillum TaxID=2630922 RepID=UPI003F4A0F24
MDRVGVSLMAALVAAAVGAGTAWAGSATLDGFPGYELKVGGQVHDYDHDYDDSDTLDLSVEVLTNPVVIAEFDSKLLQAIAAPRVMIGGSVNTQGGTNRAYAGLTWTYPFESGFYIAPAFGIAVHDGNLKRKTSPCTAAELAIGCDSRDPVGEKYTNLDEEALGTRWLFHESLEIGYVFADRITLGAYISHMSNANLGNGGNGGMSFVGARVGYLFGN